MPQDPNKLYSVHKTTIWFALSSIFLLVSLVLMLVQDYSREWKRWQEKFVEYERKQVEQELKKSEELIMKLESIKNSKDKSFDKMKSSLEDLQHKLIFIDKTLFEGDLNA